MFKLCIGADHRGYKLKSGLVEGLRAQKVVVNDIGSNNMMPSDFSELAMMGVENLLRGIVDVTVLIDDTGNGMAMIANRNKGIRACIVSDAKGGETARVMYDANVLCLAGDTSEADAMEAIMSWAGNEYIGGKQDAKLELLR